MRLEIGQILTYLILSSNIFLGTCESAKLVLKLKQVAYKTVLDFLF